MTAVFFVLLFLSDVMTTLYNATINVCSFNLYLNSKAITVIVILIINTTD